MHLVGLEQARNQVQLLTDPESVCCVVCKPTISRMRVNQDREPFVIHRKELNNFLPFRAVPVLEKVGLPVGPRMRADWYVVDGKKSQPREGSVKMVPQRDGPLAFVQVSEVHMNVERITIQKCV